MESFTCVGSILGCSACIAVGGLLLAAYKLGVIYQLFHKVGVYKSTPFIYVIFNTALLGSVGVNIICKPHSMPTLNRTS